MLWYQNIFGKQSLQCAAPNQAVPPVKAKADQWLQYPFVQSGALHLRKLQRGELLEETVDKVGDVWVLQGSMVSLISASHCLRKTVRIRKGPKGLSAGPSAFRASKEPELQRDPACLSRSVPCVHRHVQMFPRVPLFNQS